MYDEHLALALAEERGLKVTILRLFNVYGPAQPPELVGRADGHVHRGAARRRAVEIHGDGLQTRTSPTSSDTVEGFVRALETPESRGEVDQRRRDRDALDPRAGGDDPGACSGSRCRCARRSCRYDDSRQLPGRPPPGPRHDEGAGTARVRGEGRLSTRACTQTIEWHQASDVSSTQPTPIGP